MHHAHLMAQDSSLGDTRPTPHSFLSLTQCMNTATLSAVVPHAGPKVWQHCHSRTGWARLRKCCSDTCSAKSLAACIATHWVDEHDYGKCCSATCKAKVWHHALPLTEWMSTTTISAVVPHAEPKVWRHCHNFCLHCSAISFFCNAQRFKYI